MIYRYAQTVLVCIMLFFGVIVHAAARDARRLIQQSGVDNVQAVSTTKVSVTVDMALASAIIKSRDPLLTVSIPIASIGTREAKLHLSSAMMPGTPVHFSSRNGQVTDKSLNIVSYSGTIEDMPGAIVAMTFTGDEVLATVMWGGDNWSMGKLQDAGKGSMVDHIVQHMEVPFTPCGTVETALTSEMFDIGDKSDVKPQADVDTLTLKLAIEADYMWFRKFKKNRTLATAYLTQMFTFMDELYRRDLATRVVLSDVNIWEDENDGDNDTANAIDFLDEFAKIYHEEHPEVERDIAVFLTARNNGNGGGRGYIGGLCKTEESVGYSYCVGGILGDIPGSSQSNLAFDYVLIPHEVGHLCNGVHTQSCAWPGGPLDSCILSESGTCVTENLRRPRIGTIMSYCHQTKLSGGGTAPEFHERHKKILRATLERSECIGGQDFQQDCSLTLDVTNARTGEPIDDVEFALYPYSPEMANVPVKESKRTGFGTYEFISIPAGIYYIYYQQQYAVIPQSRHAYSGEFIIISVAEKNTKASVKLVPINVDQINVLTEVDDLLGAVYMVNNDFTEKYVLAYTDGKNNLPYYGVPDGQYTVVAIARNATFTPSKQQLKIPPGPISMPVMVAKSADQRIRKMILTTEYDNGVENLIGGDTVDIVDSNGQTVETLITDEHGIAISTMVIDSNVIYIHRPADERVPAQVMMFDDQYGAGGVVRLAGRKRTSQPFTSRYMFSAGPNNNYTTLTDGVELLPESKFMGYPFKVTLPWNAAFGERTTNIMWVYGSGAVSFGTKVPVSVDGSMHASRSDVDMIISAFDGAINTDTVASASVKYKITGSEPDRKLTVQWINMSMPYNTEAGKIYIPGFNFEVTLEEKTGNIEVGYGKMGKFPEGVTAPLSIGIRGTDNTDFQSLTMKSADEWKLPQVLSAGQPRSNASYSATGRPVEGTRYYWSLTFTGVDEDHTHMNMLEQRVTADELVLSRTVSTLDLYDLTGCRMVHSTNVSRLPLAGFPSGTYIVSIGMDGTTINIPVIIVR